MSRIARRGDRRYWRDVAVTEDASWLAYAPPSLCEAQRRLLRLVPAPLAESPAWCAVTDPAARVVLRGVRTRGSAGDGRREWYGASDHRAITAVSGSFDGADLGELRPVVPAPRFGFSSTPARPSVTRVVTTVSWTER